MSTNPSDPDYNSAESTNTGQDRDDDQLAQDTGSYPGTGESRDDDQVDDQNAPTTEQ